MTWVALGVVVVPFATALLTLVVGHRGDVVAKAVSVGGSALGAALAWVLALAHLGGATPLQHTYSRTGTGGGPALTFGVLVDPLSAVMLLLATTVALLVQVYSLGYLADDPRYPSYASFISLFTGAMTLVVVADDLWVLLVGWEVMGVCSYFLIAHHWELPEARAGAVKAFLMTRTADLGLLFGIFVLGQRFGTYRISAVLDAVATGALPRDALWLPALLLAIACFGKSAQWPLHTWLPDAMPGPTPISALIHAATMVAAGVFLVARLYPVFLSAPSVLTLVAVVAAVTMLLAAVYALFSHDLKRVLAWSTVSQLAYMFGGLAAGAWSAAVLHLLAHGAFKALLFLAAGSVVHGVGGATAMDRMGGLRDKLPDTFVTMTIGFAALAGVVPFVGFFSKDAVIHGAFEQAAHGRLVWPAVAWLLLASMVLTAAVTVAYCLRAWLLVFFGPGPEAAAVHRPPGTMQGPLVLLAVLTALGGVAVVAPGFLGAGPVAAGTLFHWSTSLLMTLLVLVTAAVVLVGYQRRGRAVFPPLRLPLPAVDRAYDAVLVRPVRRLALVVRAGDRDVVDAYATGAGASARGLGGLVRRSQTGSVQTYLLVVVVGAAAIAVLAGVAA